MAGCQDLEVGEGLTTKGHEEFFGGDGNIINFYFDAG